jgi:Predicted transcriptional regulator
MKAIWDKGEDISITELAETLRTKYNKDYKRTTIVTFILNLSAKGFARQYRVGRYAYVHALKSEEEYKRKLLKDQTDFWYHGDAAKVVAALCSTANITQKEIETIRGILDDLDN